MPLVLGDADVTVAVGRALARELLRLGSEGRDVDAMRGRQRTGVAVPTGPDRIHPRRDKPLRKRHP